MNNFSTNLWLVLSCTLWLTVAGCADSQPATKTQTGLAATTTSNSSNQAITDEAVATAIADAGNQPSVDPGNSRNPASQTNSSSSADNLTPTEEVSIVLNDSTQQAQILEPLQQQQAQQDQIRQNPPDDGYFEFNLDSLSVTLTEGSADPITVPIRISRFSGHNKILKVNVADAGGAQVNELQWTIANPELSADQSDSYVQFYLPIIKQPRLAADIKVDITVNDTNSWQTRTLTLRLNPVDAPDIYLLIGQSNMVGSSKPGARMSESGGPDSLNSRIRQLNVKQNSTEIFSNPQLFRDRWYNVMQPTFVIAEDPLHEPHYPGRNLKEGTRIGLGLSFAKAMLAHTSQEIILVPAAWSASSFCKNENPLLGWNVAGDTGGQFGTSLLLDRAMVRLALAIQQSGGIFRGVLWHQGEGDSNNPACASAYKRKLTSLVRHIRTNAELDRRGPLARSADAPIPFVMGSMSKGNDERGNFSLFSTDKQKIDDVHRTLQYEINNLTHASLDDLTPPAYPCGESSCIHFGAEAYREMGYRYAQGMQQLQRAQ